MAPNSDGHLKVKQILIRKKKIIISVHSTVIVIVRSIVIVVISEKIPKFRDSGFSIMRDAIIKQKKKKRSAVDFAKILQYIYILTNVWVRIVPHPMNIFNADNVIGHINQYRHQSNGHVFDKWIF